MIKWGGVYNLLNTGPGSASNAWQKGRSGAALFWSNPYLSPHPTPAKHFTDTEKEMLRHQAKRGHWSKYPSTGLHGSRASGPSCTCMIFFATGNGYLSRGRRKGQWISEKEIEMWTSVNVYESEEWKPA